MRITLFGIPTCGTVKKARQWLDEQGMEYAWIDLRETPPSRDRLERWIAQFGSKAMRNTSGGAYRALGPEKQEWDDAQWLAAFAQEPMLLKRPILERDGQPLRVGFKVADWESMKD